MIEGDGGSPEEGRNSPLSMLRHDDLPAPLMPSSPKHSPLGMPRLTPLTAYLPPRYIFFTSLTRITDDSSAAPDLGEG